MPRTPPRTSSARLVARGHIVRAAASAVLIATMTSVGSADLPADGETLLRRIRAELGDGSCTSDDQCRTWAVGALPCGGPEAYLPWAVDTARPIDAERLRQLTARHADQRRRWFEAIGLQSTCEIRPDPGARCERVATQIAHSPGRCVLRSSGCGRTPPDPVR